MRSTIDPPVRTEHGAPQRLSGRLAPVPEGSTVTMGIDITCPACGSADRVQSVPSIRASGSFTSYSSGSSSGIAITSTGFAPVIGVTSTYHRHSTDLVRALAPEPQQVRIFGWFLSTALLLVPAIFILVTSIETFTDPNLPNRNNFIDAIVLTAFAAGGFVPATATGWIGYSRATRNRRIRRGRGFAHAISSHGWYCHRCGFCYWPAPAPAPGIPARQPLVPDHFRSIVWRAAYPGL